MAVSSSPTGDKTNQANRTDKGYFTREAAVGIPFHVLLGPPKVRPESVWSPMSEHGDNQGKPDTEAGSE